ncbi:hypothetical protein Q6A90_04820 [Aliarcobacter skirrowii]|uniref:hypothetical protein n=1 Tax=Aliarcobacter skirrowii TaxID=28200 RepID=UPI0029AAD1B3|nr:hypothetical protein [Aliarcobacter skirrowii]MDX4061684.1 hypothetical protein [Aliarcobacter skirrowii]
MLKKIYLDVNAFKQISTHNNEKFTDKVKDIDKEKFAIVYSVAHLEELKSSTHYGLSTLEHIKKDLLMYNTYADKILRPDPYYDVKINNVQYMQYVQYTEGLAEEFYEDVSKAMYRNDIVENINRKILKETNELNSPENNNFEILQQSKEVIILYLVKLGILSEDLFKLAMNWKFSDIKEKFYIVEIYIELALRILENSGRYEDREKINKKRTLEKIARSWTHDTSHIIYASYCDFFISSDAKLKNKAKAIYELLEVPTIILDVNEFIDYQF